MARLNKRASCSFISILSLRRREQEWQNFRRVEYWEIIADNLHDAGSSLDWVSALDCEWRGF
jgi:hypothetical protein